MRVSDCHSPQERNEKCGPVAIRPYVIGSVTALNGELIITDRAIEVLEKPFTTGDMLAAVAKAIQFSATPEGMGWGVFSNNGTPGSGARMPLSTA